MAVAGAVARGLLNNVAFGDGNPAEVEGAARGLPLIVACGGSNSVVVAGAAAALRGLRSPVRIIGDLAYEDGG